MTTAYKIRLVNEAEEIDQTVDVPEEEVVA
jgi:hypothetical protein